MIDHDAKPGPLTRCQITGADDLELVIDLGHQPPCDSLLTKEQLNEPETTYPLRLMFSPSSGLAQLDYVVPGDVIYPPTYPYRSGISKPLADYQRAFADGVVRDFGLDDKSFVVDIGSNDGTLLTGFQRHGCSVLGVEPTEVALIARSENSVPTLNKFFTEAEANEIVTVDYGQADLITLTNAFAHMADLGEVMRGIDRLLAPNGVLIIECHYLLDVLQKTQFDTIYHEHIRTYSLKALTLLFPQYGMEVFDVARASRYGGNIRVYVQRNDRGPISQKVGKLLAEEQAAGLYEMSSWVAFRKRVEAERKNFMHWLTTLNDLGEKVVGCSAPGRASTLLNYYGVTPELMPYTGELSTSLKLGKYLPGCHIPVVDNKRLVDDKPDAIVLLAWHYADPIMARLYREGVRATMVKPLPNFDVVLDPQSQAA